MSSKCKPRVKFPMFSQSTSLEKLKSLVQKEQRLFVFLIFPQLTEASMIFLNASEHFFHIRLGEMHQNGTSVGTVIGIVALRELIEELSG